MDESESIPSVAPKSKGTHPAIWIAISVVGGIIFAAYLVGGNIEGSASGGGGKDSRHEVIYKVTDTRDGSVSLTYENSGGNTQQDASVSTPWTKRYRMKSGAFMYVSAQRGHDSGSVRCTITVDGKVVERAESSGAAVIATCSGSVP